MKISTKGRYGTRMLLDLALHHDEEPVLLRDVSRRQEIPLPYLHRLIAPLLAGGILRSTRGAKGGISLATSPDKVKLSQIMWLLEGPIAPAECIDHPQMCSRSGSCVSRDVWSELKETINGVLESITLQDLVERQRKKIQPKEGMYHI